MSPATWVVDQTDANIPLMAETLGISQLVASVLAKRDIRTKNTAIKYLAPDMKYLHDTKLMRDAEKAAALLQKAVQDGVPITVYGDYDVDGVTSTAILVKLARRLGGNVSYYIPQREEEGYGLNLSAVEKLAEAGTAFLLTCDNGIASIAEIAEAKRRGLTVVVLDHHEPGFETNADGERADILPCADAVIDPKQAACAYPFRLLCAGGLAYKFAMLVCECCGVPFADEAEFAVLAAIATFCDMVDLIDENRILAKRGLQLLNSDEPLNIGLRALMRARGLEGKAVGAFDIGYIIGPCINATGRLEHAALSVELLLTNDEQEAVSIAEKLAALNEERKALTTQAYESVTEMLPDEAAREKVLVLYSPDVHESIAGIVAGRVKERTNRPVVMLTKSNDSLVKGSARSIEGYDMFEALFANRELFVRFGGHSMAAGLTMAEENVEALRERLNAACVLTEADFIPVVHVDGEMTLDDATFALAQQLQILEPFGKGSREPLFALYNVTAQPVELIGSSKSVLRFTFAADGGRKVKGICFGKAEAFMDMLSASYAPAVVESFANGTLRGLTVRLDIVCGIEINEYNGNVSVQLRIVDFRLARK